MVLPLPLLRNPPPASLPSHTDTSCFVVDPLPLATGGVREQSGLLVVGVHGAGGDDVILVFVHQRQLGIVTSCRRKSQGRFFQRKVEEKVGARKAA